MRVLHLGFEDPLMPNAGGGSVRTYEINRRLAAMGIRITVLAQRFPGWSERVQDGVRYVPIGFGSGSNRLTRLLGYILMLPVAVLRYRRNADLIVEDFFAPFSSMAAPLWTGRPTIGHVQWLHAREKARQYKLPFHLLEYAGVRSHRRVIAMSDGLRARLTKINPALRVDVIGCGIERSALAQPSRLGRDVVFIGRLELDPKGLDLLLSAWAAARLGDDTRLVIAGLGPDEGKVRRLVNELGIAGTVDLVGWVRGETKRELLGGARIVVVPSRHETFGLVALEALAAGTPVLAFDIPCLREVIPEGCGWRVPAFDVNALAEKLAELYTDSDRLAAAGARGREFASQFDWDEVARRQAEVYYDAAVPKPARWHELG